MSRKRTIAKEEEDEYNRDEKEERVRPKREKDRGKVYVVETSRQTVRFTANWIFRSINR